MDLDFFEKSKKPNPEFKIVENPKFLIRVFDPIFPRILNIIGGLRDKSYIYETSYPNPSLDPRLKFLDLLNKSLEIQIQIFENIKFKIQKLQNVHPNFLYVRADHRFSYRYSLSFITTPFNINTTFSTI